jgi:hypothetical protein
MGLSQYVFSHNRRVGMNRAVLEEFKIFCGKDIKWDDWLWCNHCYRCYKAHEFKKLKASGKIFLLCHYKDCDGDLPIDSRLWSRLIANHPGLPKKPQRGKIYDFGIKFR